MPLSNVQVVDNTGTPVFTIDSPVYLPKDRSNRYGTLTLTDRLFATPLAAYMFTCIEGVWQVQAAVAALSVTGGAACVVDVLVSPGVTAPAGTTQLTGTISLVGTAPFKTNGVIIASPTRIYPGDNVSRVIAGTVGSVEGTLTVLLKRVE